MCVFNFRGSFLNKGKTFCWVKLRRAAFSPIYQYMVSQTIIFFFRGRKGFCDAKYLVVFITRINPANAASWNARSGSRTKATEIGCSCSLHCTIPAITIGLRRLLVPLKGFLLFCTNAGVSLVCRLICMGFWAQYTVSYFLITWK